MNGKKISIQKDKILCFVAGKSGGHIVPCLTLAQHAHETNTVLFFTSTSNLDTTLINNSTVVDQHIALDLPGIPKQLWRMPSFLLKFVVSFVKNFFILVKNKPAKIISTGSYIALPVCLAGWVLRIPITLYELNVVPGKAIKFLAPFATTINCVFNQTKKQLPRYTCDLVKYPIKPAYKQIQKTQHDKKTILILGGSQGSVFLNNLIMDWIQLHKNNALNITILHQTGAAHIEHVKNFYTHNALNAQVFAFHEQLEKLYAQADLVICRAGAGSLFETLHFKKPCIVIPLQIKGNTHQVNNAYAMAHEYPELFTVFEQKTLENKKESLYEVLNNHLFKNT